MSVPAWMVDILVCPIDRVPLQSGRNSAGEEVLYCPVPGQEGQVREYPVRDGIPVLLAEEAQVVSAH